MKVFQSKQRTTRIILDDRFCKGCSLCIQVCPQRLFVQGEKRSRGGYRMPEVTREEECSNCLLCEMTCPDLALTVLQEEK